MAFNLIIWSGPAVYAQIEQPEDWESQYKARYAKAEPFLDTTNGNDDRKFAWDAQYWLRAYVSMADVTGDTVYLDRAVRLIDHMMKYRDDARVARGEIDLHTQPYTRAPNFYINNPTVPMKAWRRWAGDKYKWRGLMLDNGMITSSIMRFVDFVYNKPPYAAYQARAEEYIARVEETVAEFENDFLFKREPYIPGSWYYPRENGKGHYSGAVELNHSCTMSVTLLLLHKVKGGIPAHIKKAKAVWMYFKSDLKKVENDAYSWQYHPQKPGIKMTSSGAEDLQHAHIDLGFAIMAYKMNIGASLEDMQRFTRSFTRNIYKGEGQVSWGVDGVDPMKKNEYYAAAYDWIDLTEFDPQVLDIAREVYEKKNPKVNWGKPALGWAEILRWSQNLTTP